jgi:uncharacterized repeat protein (TIGR01451 family)
VATIGTQLEKAEISTRLISLFFDCLAQEVTMNLRQPNKESASGIRGLTNKCPTGPSTGNPSPLARCLQVLKFLAGTVALVFLAPAVSADVPVKVIITEAIQLGGIDPDNSIGDFYAKVIIDNGPVQSNKPGCSDSGLGGIFYPAFLFRDFTATPDCTLKTTPWNFTREVPDDNDPIPVEIQLWDSDSITGDDKADLSDAAPDDSSLDLLIDPATGRWSGDIEWPHTCSRMINELGQDHVRVCIQVSLDSDGDGLLDTWERDGIYIDSGGIALLDLDLPALGADPMHKDLFIELDSMPDNLPGAANIQRMKEAFASAPIGAGGRDNPDGLPGINLWVDTGGIPDPTSLEDGVGACDDGIDNGPDGLIDFADPDCLAGDNLGGGQVLVNRDDISGLSETFYEVKAANFDPSRKYVFRYGLLSARHRATTTPAFADVETVQILAPNSLLDESQSWLFNEWKENYLVRIISGTGMGQERRIDGNSSTRLTLKSDWDTIPDETSEYELFGVGGLGEVGKNGFGGNDFIVFNKARGGFSASVMHEIGHTLHLRHGGDESHNCKPNYVSVMNYDHRFILNLNDGPIMDFSPPRHAGPTQRSLPISPLDENDLDETLPLDTADEENYFVIKCAIADGEDPADEEEDSCSDGLDNDDDGLADLDDPKCYLSVRKLLNAPVDWNASDIACTGDADDTSVIRNIDFGGPKLCQKADVNGVLGEITTHDDWTNIAFSFLENGDLASAPTTEPPNEWTMEEEQQYAAQLETTDLSIVKSAAPDPVEVGTDLVYTLTVRNEGPQPAIHVTVRDILPGSVAYQGDAAECLEEPLGDLSCNLGIMPAGAESRIDMSVSTDDVCADGLPRELVNVASVAHGENGAGGDPDAGNNLAELRLTPVDTTAPTIDSLSVDPGELWPPNHKMHPVSIAVTASDQCDAEPVCRLASIASNEPLNGEGDGNTETDWEITGQFTAELRAERAGPGEGRVYTLTAECADASGNVASDSVSVSVAHDSRP